MVDRTTNELCARVFDADSETRLACHGRARGAACRLALCGREIELRFLGKTVLFSHACRPGQRAPEIRFPIGVGIAGTVAQTGEVRSSPPLNARAC
jgi:hypothetical protein